ncbi:MAG: FtsX-like permease family protein [Acidobacteria bacterium]|nr:FtsX-like permease family protein [Acidobacteriota bacterium]
MTSPKPAGWAQAIARRLVRGPNSEFVLADLADDFSAQGSHVRYLRLAAASRRAMRGAGGTPMQLLGAVASDTRFAARGLRKNPGFAVVAVLTLALGIGANAAIFTVVHGVLLAPLPYDQPERVVNVWQVFRDWQNSEIQMFRDMADRFSISWPVYLEWTERSQTFDAITVYSSFPTIVDGPELAEWVSVVQTTHSFVDVVGVQPAMGRWFTAEEGDTATRVVVVSHNYWQTRLGGAPDAVGRSVRLHGSAYSIIGVMPDGFYFPRRGFDMWYPVAEGRRNNRFTNQSLSSIGRLGDGMTIEDAQLEMDAVADQIIADIPDSIDAGVRLVSRVEEVAGSTAGTLRLLAGAVGLVLLVAAANVAGLLLVRNTTRQQELAVRTALGARRSRLAGQLMVEGAVLAAAGGLLALVAVAGTLGWIRALLPTNTPRVDDIVVSAPVVGYVAATSALVAVLFAIIAVLQLRRSEPADGLRETSRVLAGSRGRSLLVVGEIAVSVILLTGALLLTTSYLRLAAVESGVETQGLLSMYVAAPIDIWHDAPEELRAFYTEADQNLETLAGIDAFAAVANLPFAGSRSSGSFGLIAEAATPEDSGWSLEQDVSPSYFDVMGIPIVQGRTLSSDEAGPQEMVVSTEFAEQYFPDGSPLGETIWEQNTGAHVIVGVAADVRHSNLTEKIEAKRYRLFERAPDAAASYVIRVNGDSGAVAERARAAILEIGPGVTVRNVATMTDLVRRTTALPRFRTLLLAMLAGIAILLSGLGLYGVVAYAVAARRREFGLRMTLGAGGPQVARLVLRDGLRLTLPGIMLGIAGALMTTSWLASYLYKVNGRDPMLLGLTALAVAGLAIAAMALPAWRALRVDPMVALRTD